METRMSTKEAQRFGIMQQVDKKILTLRAASEELCLSLSQTKKIRKRYRLEGPKGLISKHLGKIRKWNHFSESKKTGQVCQRKNIYKLKKAKDVVLAAKH